MACCGNKRKPFRTNGKVCPRCGWVMNRVHKYDTNSRTVVKYWLCSNKTRKAGAAGGACAFKETIK
jgi:hypothetical protein